MEKHHEDYTPKKFAVIINLLVIIAIAITGIFIAYFSIAIFTKHGEETRVPGVENMSYTAAIEKLHDKGFNVEIRDSLFRDDIKPGYVIEQFPKSNSTVKPGRKIFLYINAVHPKEVVIDDGPNRAELALKDWSLRQVKSRLTELGFKNVRTVTVLGADDRVVKLLGGGKPIYKMERLPVNIPIIIEVSDGRLNALRDSLYDAERLNDFYWNSYDEGAGNTDYSYGGTVNEETKPAEETEYYEEPDYFPVEDGGEY